MYLVVEISLISTESLDYLSFVEFTRLLKYQLCLNQLLFHITQKYRGPIIIIVCNRHAKEFAKKIMSKWREFREITFAQSAEKSKGDFDIVCVERSNHSAD